MIIYIKNMVCNRCKEVVKNEFINVGLHPILVELGEVTIEDNSKISNQLKSNLEQHGFEILREKNKQTIEKIKNVIVRIVYENYRKSKLNLSETLSTELNRDYSSLSKLFSEVEGITIEKFLIQLRIERVKELLVYDELTLSEIADKLNYSSVSYLSNQFKKTTGLSPSFFKELPKNRRKPIDEL